MQITSANIASQTPPAPAGASLQGSVLNPCINTLPSTSPFTIPEEYFLLHLSPKVRSKLLEIAKLRVHRPDLKDAQIAGYVGFKNQANLSVYYNMAEYQEAERIERKRRAKIVDETLTDNIEAMHEAWTQHVPGAMKTFFEAIESPKADLKTRMEAARTILKLDPRRTFTEQSVNDKANDTTVNLSVNVLNQALKSCKEEFAKQSPTEVNVTSKQLQEQIA
jgi:hypothetical protein